MSTMCNLLLTLLWCVYEPTAILRSAPLLAALLDALPLYAIMLKTRDSHTLRPTRSTPA